MQNNEKEMYKRVCCTSGFLLRFEVAGTNVSIARTKDGGRARSAKWEGGCPLPQKMLEFLRPQGAFWAISGQFGFLF